MNNPHNLVSSFYYIKMDRGCYVFSGLNMSFLNDISHVQPLFLKISCLGQVFRKILPKTEGQVDSCHKSSIENLQCLTRTNFKNVMISDRNI